MKSRLLLRSCLKSNETVTLSSRRLSVHASRRTKRSEVVQYCINLTSYLSARRKQDSQRDAGVTVFKQFLTLFAIIAFSTIANAQNFSKEVKSSPAFAEIILRMTEIEADLEELLVSYTEEFPKVKESRYELSVLQNDVNNMAKMKANETGKLSQALGKLLVRKAQLATDYWVIKNRYNADHPDAKKAKRKLEIFEKAVRKIL